MVRAGNPQSSWPSGTAASCTFGVTAFPSGPKAQPGLGSDVPPDQLAFPSCDGEGEVRMSDYYFLIANKIIEQNDALKNK